MESAAFLLDILAPLITGIQKLSAKIVALSSTEIEGLGAAFQSLCAEVERLLGSLKHDRPESDVVLEEDLDREMKKLMLSALMKKVQVEVQAIRKNAEVDPISSGAIPSIEPPDDVETSDMLDLASFLAGKRTRSSSSTSSSPLAENLSNPFIFHSTSLSPPLISQQGQAPPVDRIPSIDSTLGSSHSHSHGDRKQSTAIPIGIPRRKSSNPSRSPTRALAQPYFPIRGLPGGQQHSIVPGQMPPGASFSAFVGGAQSSLWATNIRLASFQNSLLFSPSPIAVRRIVGHGATRL